MSRRHLLADRIDKNHVVLVEVEHAVLDEPIRVVLDNQALTALGKDWQPGKMDVVLPNEVDGTRSARVSVQNVDWRIGEAARRMITPATFWLKVVATDEPDTIVSDFPPLHLANAEGNEACVSGELTSILNTSNPARNARCTKDSAPAAYR